MIESSTPIGSSLPGFGSLESGTSSVIAISATITIGTLTRKTEPHQKCSISTPPVIGPMAMARPTAPAQMPIALGCSCRSKTFMMMASVAGITKAPPRPITARKVISSPGEEAIAESSEPTPKTSMPPSSVHLRPIRSPSRPAVKSRPAKTRVYELIDHSRSLWPAPSPVGAGEAMVFIATLRIELSRTTTSRARISVPRIAQRRLWTASGIRGAAGPVVMSVFPVRTRWCGLTSRMRLVTPRGSE